MNRFYHVLVALALLAVSLSAQQVNIFGKVRDTSGMPLEGAIVSLAAHPTMADTTGKDGLFAINGPINSIVLKRSSAIQPFTKCVGNMVYFAVNEQTAVSIDVFNTRGQQLAQPLNKIIAAGTYQMPIATNYGKQILIVRVRRGNDAMVFSMQNMNNARKASATAFDGTSSASTKVLSSLSKTTTSPAIDTLVFSRRGSLTQRLPITSYTATDSLNMALHTITDPYLICYALNIVPSDTNYTPHFRDDTTYMLSVIASNIGGGNAFSSEVYVSSTDTCVKISSSKGSLSNVQAGLSKVSTPINFILKRTLAPGRKVRLYFHFIDSWSGTTREWFDTLYWAPKPFLFEGAVLDDDNIAPTNGDGDGKVDPGERIGIAPVVKNMNDAPITTITGRILSTYAGLDTLAKNSFFSWSGGTLAPGKDGTLDSEFVSVVSSSIKFVYGSTPLVKDSVRYDVLLSGTYAGGNCQWVLPVSCAAQVSDTARKLTVTKVQCDVSISPVKSFYLTGDTVRLVATPFLHNHFVCWNGDTSGNINSIKLTMNKSKTVSAICGIDSFSLTVNATNGTVSKNSDKQMYPYGDTITLTAVPTTDKHLVVWSGAVSGNINPIKLAINANSTVVMNCYSLIVSCGFEHTMILKNDGSLWAMGHNARGQLGTGDTISRSTPVQIMSGVAGVFTGYFHSMILKNDGSLWATGFNSSGQLGTDDTVSRSTPVQIMTGVTSATAGMEHTMILKSDGALWATGANFNGELGDNTIVDKHIPVQVMTGVAGVSAGYNYSMILRSDGSLWAMGRNYSGQLGDPTMPQGDGERGKPVQIMIGVSAVSTGSSHTMILKNDGTLWATGANDDGQLGDGTKVDKSTPIQIMTGVFAVSTGDHTTMILKNGGSLLATGKSYYGELGNGSTYSNSTPQQIMTTVSAVSAGGYHTMILKNDGTLWATGRNEYGQLGTGDTVSHVSPVQVQ